jgi:hypothetical protein
MKSKVRDLLALPLDATAVQASNDSKKHKYKFSDFLRQLNVKALINQLSTPTTEQRTRSRSHWVE